MDQKRPQFFPPASPHQQFLRCFFLFLYAVLFFSSFFFVPVGSTCFGLWACSPNLLVLLFLGCSPGHPAFDWQAPVCFAKIGDFDGVIAMPSWLYTCVKLWAPTDTVKNSIAGNADVQDHALSSTSSVCLVHFFSGERYVFGWTLLSVYPYIVIVWTPACHAFSGKLSQGQ